MMMNVPKIHPLVNSIVEMMLDPLPAIVIMDLSWIVIRYHVLVRIMGNIFIYMYKCTSVYISPNIHTYIYIA